MNTLYTWEGFSSEKSFCASFRDVLGTLASFFHSLYPEYIHTQNLNKISIRWHHKASAEDIHLYESRATSKNTEMLAQSFYVLYQCPQCTDENTMLRHVHKILHFVRYVLVFCSAAYLSGLQTIKLKCALQQKFCVSMLFFCRFPWTQPTR
jgi:hypothetical protein